MVYGKMFYFIIMTLVFNNIDWQMLCFIVSWQMFLPGRCYCHMRCDRGYCHWGRCYPLIFLNGRCCFHMVWKMLYHFSVCCNTLYWLMLLPGGRGNSQPHIIVIIIDMLTDVIAQWQMEWPLHGVSELSTGKYYYQVADGWPWVELF